MNMRPIMRWEVIRDELNGMLRGWANYFAYGSPYVTFRLVDIHVAERVRNLLRRRHKLPRATSRFGYPRWPLQIPPLMATSNSPSGEDRSVWIVTRDRVFLQ